METRLGTLPIRNEAYDVRLFSFFFFWYHSNHRHIQLVKETRIISSEAVIAYLHRDLVMNPPDDRNTNARTVEVTLTAEESAANVDANESVQEIDATVKDAFTDRAKYYTADCALNPWNRDKIRASGLRPQYLPLTPEVHFLFSCSISPEVHRVPFRSRPRSPPQIRPSPKRRTTE